MKKIEFHNDREPALDETTLNTMQGNIEEAISYSSSEKEIGVWIDGKKMYRKVIQATLPSGSGWTTIYQNAISNFSKVISIRGFFDSGDATYMLPMGEGSFFINLDIDENGNLMCTRNGWGAYTAYITIEYTKNS